MDRIDKNLNTCRICKNRDHNTFYEVREMMLGLRDKHSYFECAECGCLQILKPPENIKEYYPSEDYYSYNPAKSATGFKGSLVKLRDSYSITGKSVLGKLIHQIYPHDKLPLLRNTNVKQESRILDVGCGAGQLLNSMKEVGFKHLLGIDPFITKNIQYENGLTIEKKCIHDLPVENEFCNWDLIMFNHSFEHALDQQNVLIKTFKLLKPDGVCLLRIPTVSSWAWRTYGVDWVQLDAPRHFFLHSIDSVRKLAEQTGFILEDVIYDSNAFQYWGSEQYQKGISLYDGSSYLINPDKSPFSSNDIREFEKHSGLLNKSKTGDQAAFYLKKPL